MKKLFTLLFLFFYTLSYSQFTFEGYSNKTLFLKDSTLPQSISITKSLFCTKQHSYFLTNIKKYEGKHSKTERIILKIENRKIDFQNTKSFQGNLIGWESDDVSNDSFKVVNVYGIGTFYDEKDLILTFATNSQEGIYLQMAGGALITVTNLVGIKSVPVIIGLNSVGLVLTGIGFIRWLDAYRFLKVYSKYMVAVDIKDLNFNKYITTETFYKKIYKFE
jgi:hypothetical protein